MCFCHMRLSAIMQTSVDRRSSHTYTSQWQDDWKLISVINPSLVDDLTILQRGFDLPRCYWTQINHFWTKQRHWTSCSNEWGLATTDKFTCGKQQTMFHIISSCPQTELEGSGFTLLTMWSGWWHLVYDNNSHYYFRLTTIFLAGLFPVLLFLLFL